MIILLTAITALATGYVMFTWKALATREVRWKLYGLRDELRWRAIETPRVAASEAFKALDARLTSHVQMVPTLTLWFVIVPLFAHRDWVAATKPGRRTRQLVEELNDAEVSRIFRATDAALGVYAIKRHPILIGGAILALVGGLVGLDQWRKTSSTIGGWLDTLIGAGGDDVARRMASA